MFCTLFTVKSAALTREKRLEIERLELVAIWMQSAFRQYADQCAYWKGEIQTNIRIQIDRYAEEFGRILHGEVEMSDEDDPQTLRTDLFGLKKSGCPASGLVELMLASTSDFGVTISDLLFRAEILDENLRSHKNLGFPSKPRRAIKPGVPLSIHFMQKAHPGGHSAARTLALFYVLLKHFGYGHSTLTQMLRTMQYARRRVPPVADYLQTGRDTFTVSAVQRRVCRFFKADPASKGRLQQEILQYLSDEESQHHQRSLLGDQIWSDQDLYIALMLVASAGYESAPLAIS